MTIALIEMTAKIQTIRKIRKIMKRNNFAMKDLRQMQGAVRQNIN